MDLSRIPLFEAITRGYTARDVKPPSFAELVGRAAQRLPMATTAPGHIVPVRDGGAFALVTEKPDERSPNGNAVELDEQMMKISDTANDYALTTNLYREQLGLFKLVLGHGSSGG